MADTFTKTERSRIMSLVRSTDTTPELAVRRIVRSLGYRYRLHVRELPGTPDIVFRRLAKIIDVCGCFWHMHGCGRCRIPQTRRRYWKAKLLQNKDRDARNRRALTKMGWRVLVVWECQTRDPERLAKRISRFLAD